MGEAWVQIPHDVQAVAGLILALTLVRLVHDQNKVAPGEQKEEAMTSRKKSLRSRFRQLVAAMTETVWAYGVGVAAARPLPVGHVLSLASKAYRRCARTSYRMALRSTSAVYGRYCGSSSSPRSSLPSNRSTTA